MNYTPHANLTDDELVLAVCNKESPSSLELEMAERLSSKLSDETNYDEGFSDGYAAWVVKKTREIA